MDFVLWACHSMHVISIATWFGGLIFLNAVLLPVFEHDGQSRSNSLIAVLKRFQGFVWSSFWTALVTGLILMLLSPRFLWFNVSTSWLLLLAAKEISFAFIAFFTWQTSKVVVRLEQSVTEQGDMFDRWRLTYVKLIRRILFLGIASGLCSAGMIVAKHG